MTILLVLHPCLRRVYEHVFPTKLSDAPPTGGKAKDDDKPEDAIANADARLRQRVSFDYGFGIILILALHGISAFKILTILWVNYTIATRLPRAQIPIATWLFNISILFSNELLHGYPLADLARVLSSSNPDSALITWAKWLDGVGGIVPRWEVLFKITVLRLISFNMDYYWSLDYRSVSPVEVRNLLILHCKDSRFLTLQRRNKSIHPHSQNVIVSQRLHHQQHIIHKIMWLTFFTRRSTLPGQSLPSMITSTNNITLQLL